MKKMLALVLALAMIVSLVACGSDNPTTDATTAKPVASNPGSNTEAPPAGTTEAPTDPVDTEADRYGGTLVIVQTPGDILDPMKDSGWRMCAWTLNVFENILYRDASGNLAPGVCEFELSADNLTLKLWVREGLTFHDGSPVEIEDVLATLQRAEKLISKMKKNFAPFVKSETIDGKVLTIEFSEYDVNTLSALAAKQTWTVVMPKEICEKYGTETPITEVSDCIGTGPYKVVSFEAGVSVGLEKYEGYVPCKEGYTGQAAPKKAYMDKVQIVRAGEANVDFMKIQTGEVNLLLSGNANLVEAYAASGLQVISSPQTMFNYATFNCQNESVPTYDVNFRKAVAAALDYNELLAFGKSEASLTYGAYSPVGGGYSADAYAAADYHGDANIELAKAYLAKSGYNGEEFVYVCATDKPDYSPFVKERLEAVGINVKVEYMEYNTVQQYLNDYKVNNWGMVILASDVASEIPTAIPANFYSNYWPSAERDALTAEFGKLVLGSKESQECWAKIDKLMADECPGAVLGYSADLLIMSADLNWTPEVQGWKFFYNAYWSNPSEH